MSQSTADVFLINAQIALSLVSMNLFKFSHEFFFNNSIFSVTRCLNLIAILFFLQTWNKLFFSSSPAAL